MNTRLVVTLVLGISASTCAHASLLARAGGMVYDDVNKITWAADANLFKTQAEGNANLVNQIIAGNGGVIHDTPNVYDGYTGTYNLTTADFNTGSGEMTWWGAQAWANNLTLGGVKGWSLPTNIPGTGGYNQSGSQMGDLFYNQLGGVAGTSITTTHNANYNLFTNVQNNTYWSGTESGGLPYTASTFSTIGFQGLFSKDSRLTAWAVRPGDVAAIPVPGAFWLFGGALVGLMGFKRRGNIG